MLLHSGLRHRDRGDLKAGGHGISKALCLAAQAPLHILYGPIYSMFSPWMLPKAQCSTFVNRWRGHNQTNRESRESSQIV